MRITTSFAAIALTVTFAFGVHAVSAETSDLGAPPPPGAVRVAIPAWSQADLAALRAAPAPVAQAIERSARLHGVPIALVEAVAWQESRYAQDAVSPRGALGVMQLTPDTAKTLGVDALDLDDNVDGGCAYLAKLLARYGDTRLALAAYNAGPRVVDRYDGIPPYAETRAYVAAIMARLENGPGEA